jgi:hypothetical protein
MALSSGGCHVGTKLHTEEQKVPHYSSMKHWSRSSDGSVQMLLDDG